MPRAPKAIATPYAYYVDCCHCHEPIPEPASGSYMWEALDPRLDGKTTITHHACGGVNTLPKVKRGAL